MIKPASIMLDASSICQLDCPSCPRAQGKTREFVGEGFLKLDDFKKLVDENPWIRIIELSNWGEIFLNPELAGIIEYAYKKNVVLTANNGVNLNNADEKTLEAVVKYEFLSITCSIDGASNETYSLYRRGGDFNRVLENIRKINHFKEKYRSKYPKLTWQFLVFGHNEHEIPKARKMAGGLNMVFHPKLSWDDYFSPIKDRDFVKGETGWDYMSRSEYHRKHGAVFLKKKVCSQLWLQPVLNWDGKVLGCCVNYWKDYGNAFQSSLLNVLNGEKMNYARGMVLGRRREREDIPCTSCRYYKKTKEDEGWLTTGYLRGKRLEAKEFELYLNYFTLRRRFRNAFRGLTAGRV
jgi:MoaA/NifB/PqqE/SkfB family radical SAM enzyme